VPYPNTFATHFLGVGGVVIHDKKILLVKLTYGGAKNRFLVPGGLVEKGETLREGLIREILEETNMKVNPTEIIGIRSMVRDSDGLTDVYTVFKCELLSDPHHIKPQDSEINEVAWIEINELDQRDDVPQYTKTIVTTAIEKEGMRVDGQLTKSVKERLNLQKYEQFWI
jgi:ADP-ribose pyrophosphatase YjhB (NUDIX family)